MKYKQVYQLVEEAYKNSKDDFAQWMWPNHLQVVVKETENLAKRMGANEDIAVAGALLHDFGDAFVHRFDANHEKVGSEEGQKILKAAGYTAEEVQVVFDEVITPHSCKDGILPTTLEGKVMATADAIAHLDTDFYLQFCWMHLPENKNYEEYKDWVRAKIDRDFNHKIFFEEVKKRVRPRYEALQLLFKE